MWKVIILVVGSVFQTSSDIFTLQHYYTAISGIKGIPEFVEYDELDGKEICYYDSSIRSKVPRRECMATLDPRYWNTSTKESLRNQKEFERIFIWKRHKRNDTGGVHTLQMTCGCQYDSKTGKHLYYETKQAYDGEELTAPGLPDFTYDCVKTLKMYILNVSGCVDKTVPPEVSVFLSGFPPSTIVCYATGFCPDVNITWYREGEEVNGSVSDLLPNGDGTYQKRATISISPDTWMIEHLHTLYTCKVEHGTGFLEITEYVYSYFWIAVVSVVVLTVILSMVVGGIMCKRNNNQGCSCCSCCADSSPSSPQDEDPSDVDDDVASRTSLQSGSESPTNYGTYD